MVVRPNGQRFMVGDKDARGFPDLVVARGQQVYFWELKKELGKTTPHQDEWLAKLAEAGMSASVMKPHDWAAIEALLE